MAHVINYLNAIQVYTQAGERYGVPIMPLRKTVPSMYAVVNMAIVEQHQTSAVMSHGHLLPALVDHPLLLAELATMKHLILTTHAIIPVGAYTHLNFAFLYIDPDNYSVVPMESNQTDFYSRFAALKDYGVEVWISIGGYSMNDPGIYSTVFTDLAASTTAQNEFFTSLLDFLEEYGFDGVDIDWEYPGASNRYGTSADYANFVTFIENMRSALGSSYGVSITLPSSYWYLQYFDIVNLANHVDWFNFMSYDVYGSWDTDIASIGAYVYASTNLTTITADLSLLWHNNISASQVNLGLGFYGRSYTLEDTSCVDPGCAYSSAGNAGPCTQTAGILSYAEIVSIINDTSRNATVWLDEASSVKIATYDGDQWVSYDDPETLQLKMNFANSECIGGLMVWSVDEDNDGELSATLTNSTDLFPAVGSGEVYIGSQGEK
ncbi:hypothetical protein BP5796_01191 [Coleophoma crateriformis]|uniref:chitinase n=1 Tax=Coleophoma crateriformis TaxID=565419 RepID=A0A3D8SZP6_9HELO|nr:hypothetical protein BP5796_01191 [Coleophoma crateriformis]